MDIKKVCITFAGAVGSSKSPIANYISTRINLPIINNDIIRTEVREDLEGFDEQEYKKRCDERVQTILSSGISFIYDGSIDREWKSLKEVLVKHDYQSFIISLDLSKELLLGLYEKKGYHESKQRVDQLLSDHQKFITEYASDIGVHITDLEFPDRLNIGCAAAVKFLETSAIKL